MYQKDTKYIHTVFPFFFHIDIRTISLLSLRFLTPSKEVDCPVRCCCGLTCVSPKRYVQVLTPQTCECNLICKSGLCRCNQVKLRSYWIRVMSLEEKRNLV